ncbi:MAG TPA: alpha,alpha-trehalase TreF [Rhizomicrobium sp.]
MKKRLSICLLTVGLALGGAANGTQVQAPPPSVAFKELYVRVAKSGLFTDFKQFADAVPKESPETILAAYRKERPNSTAALDRFLRAHFDFEAPASSGQLPPPGLPVDQHIARLWKVLTRDAQTPPPYSSLLALPHPYVVPGGRFTELYYWDSYFTMLGLGSADSALRAGTVDDFAYMIRTYGHIPNGTRTYYLSRSQPPFFFEMAGLTPPDKATGFAHFLPELKQEYAYWMTGENEASPGRAVRNVVGMPDGSKLNRYWDERDTPRDEEYAADLALSHQSHEPPPVLYRNIRAASESGWDFSSRWLEDKQSLSTIETTDIVPVDLNSLLYGLERAIALGCGKTGDAQCSRQFSERAAKRRASMNRYLWDGRAEYYKDFDWHARQQRDVLSAATLYPLFVGAAGADQAARVAKTVEERLLKAGGVSTTENRTGQQWDAPNGWAPLQWIAVSGLRDYGQDRLAQTIALRWLHTVSHTYLDTGRLMEKYDVYAPCRKGGGGEYPLQDGFGWTNGVTVALIRLYPDWRRSSAAGSSCGTPAGEG